MTVKVALKVTASPTFSVGVAGKLEFMSVELSKTGGLSKDKGPLSKSVKVSVIETSVKEVLPVLVTTIS